MLTEQAGFADNWAYLKTELNWLERMLMVAVARQKKETKELDRIAQSRADRATNHWWQGVISTDGHGVYDEHRQPDTKPKTSYNQQLEMRLRASQKQGVVLSLPLLCDRLKLTQFEKHLVLLSLAPEVHRRYARLYRYLQSEEGGNKVQGDLPTVELALRLLCRDDKEWQTARSHLFSKSPLVAHQLLYLLPRPFDVALNHCLRLSDEMVHYLLSDSPSVEALENLLALSTAASQVSHLNFETTKVRWDDLPISKSLVTALQALAQPGHLGAGGRVVAWTGSQGNGQTMAAQAVAHALKAPLVSVDLASVQSRDYDELVRELETQKPQVLLLKSAEYWLRRSSALPPTELHRLLTNRRRQGALTLLSVTLAESVALRWQQQIDEFIAFPNPSASDRLLLWQRAIPPEILKAAEVNWQQLAKPPLTGDAIEAIARTALQLQQTAGETQLTLSHLKQAFNQHGKLLSNRR